MLRHFLKKIKSFILDLLFPISCLFCGKVGNFICPKCGVKIERYLNFGCPFCGVGREVGKFCVACRKKKNFPLFLDHLFVLANYNNVFLRKIIFQFKYQSVFLIGRDLAALLFSSKEIREFLKQKKCYLVPIPMFYKKEKKRGYNQAKLIAFYLSYFLKVDVLDGLIIKKRNTVAQMSLQNKRLRKKNVEDVFYLNANFDFKEICQKQIVLIDDVLTTGATLNNCACLLKKAGFKKVAGLVIARQTVE